MKWIFDIEKLPNNIRKIQGVDKVNSPLSLYSQNWSIVENITPLAYPWIKSGLSLMIYIKNYTLTPISPITATDAT